MDPVAGPDVGGGVAYGEAVLEHILPLAYVTEGEFVPEIYILREDDLPPVHGQDLAPGKGPGAARGAPGTLLKKKNSPGWGAPPPQTCLPVFLETIKKKKLLWKTKICVETI